MPSRDTSSGVRDTWCRASFLARGEAEAFLTAWRGRFKQPLDRSVEN